MMDGDTTHRDDSAPETAFTGNGMSETVIEHIWVEHNVLGADPDWWQDETDPGARGVDQYLADEAQLGRGLGSEMVRQFLARTFAEDPAVTQVQTDPAPHNGRAIRAYERAGFRKLREVITPDGPALLMLVTRADFARLAAPGDVSRRIVSRSSPV
jgi:GNAT superfamily N-acetyltransferase